MESDLKWLLGILVTIVAAFAAMLIAAFRNLSLKMTNSNGEIHKKIDEGDTALTNKIDDVKEEYVRRDDLDGHIQRLDKGLKDLRDEQKAQGDEQHARHLKVMEAIAAGQR